jgi:hypothetical protein
LSEITSAVGELVQQLGALARRRVEPFRERPLRALDGFVDLLRRHVRYLRNRLAGRRVEDVEGGGAFGGCRHLSLLFRASAQTCFGAFRMVAR